MLTRFLPLFKNLTACAEDLSDNFLDDSPPSEPSGEKRLFRLLPESVAMELRLLESESSFLSSSLFLLACKRRPHPLTNYTTCWFKHHSQFPHDSIQGPKGGVFGALEP